MRTAAHAHSTSPGCRCWLPFAVRDVVCRRTRGWRGTARRRRPDVRQMGTKLWAPRRSRKEPPRRPIRLLSPGLSMRQRRHRFGPCTGDVSSHALRSSPIGERSRDSRSSTASCPSRRATAEATTQSRHHRVRGSARGAPQVIRKRVAGAASGAFPVERRAPC